jgi:hypothetical protein
VSAEDRRVGAALTLKGGETLEVPRHHRLLSADRGDWVHAGDIQTLQITGSFANNFFPGVAQQLVEASGGTYSSVAGGETMTFILGAP